MQGLLCLLTEVPIFAHAILKLNCIEIMKFVSLFLVSLPYSGVPRNFVRGGGCSTNSVEDRENVDLGAVSP